jgi:S-adenosylmethionine:diacylglycerol 3-amino-3-carboxypropyl transferase
MASLVHATLTEDEDVLAEALGPHEGDRVLVLFARGNGDAALALLAGSAAGAPERVWACDWFDPPALRAQLALKLEAIRAWEPADFRRWLGLEPGMDASERGRRFDELLAALGEDERAFWRARRHAAGTALVAADETRRFGRLMVRLAPLLAFLKRWPALRTRLLKGAMAFSALFYPAEEQQHSLGYRQLLQDPENVLDPLIDRARAAPDGDLIRADRFSYLSAAGLARLRERAGRLALAERDRLPAGCNRIYLSNLIDYLPADEFDRLLDCLARAAAPPFRLFYNSTYRSNLQHPHVMPAIGRKLVRIDRELTARLRERDRLGVYPGLAVLVDAGDQE